MYVKMRTSPRKPTEPKRMCILFPNVYICKLLLPRSKGKKQRLKQKKGKTKTNILFMLIANQWCDMEAPTETKYC